MNLASNNVYMPKIITYNSTDEIPIEIRHEIIQAQQKSIKMERNRLLLETDKYVLPDYPITPENLQLIKQYRQALRDFTSNNYVLPEKPEIINNK
jgi:predicted ATP-dependent Lon-type protease